MVFKPTLNITEQIAEHLAQMVIREQFTGGTRIQELKIANELGVSRGSVREALLILERRQLIEIVPRKGAVVNDICMHEALELMELFRSSERRLFAPLLQPMAPTEGLMDSAGALEAMDQGARSGALDDVLEARRDFYLALLQGSTRYLQGVFECLLPGSQRLIRRLIQQSDVDVHDIPRFYKALHDALQTKDEERVAELLNAFHKRLRGLCERAQESRAAVHKTLKKIAFS